jgi:hypothetical protein
MENPNVGFEKLSVEFHKPSAGFKNPNPAVEGCWQATPAATITSCPNSTKHQFLLRKIGLFRKENGFLVKSFNIS